MNETTSSSSSSGGDELQPVVSNALASSSIPTSQYSLDDGEFDWSIDALSVMKPVQISYDDDSIAILPGGSHQSHPMFGSVDNTAAGRPKSAGSSEGLIRSGSRGASVGSFGRTDAQDAFFKARTAPLEEVDAWVAKSPIKSRPESRESIGSGDKLMGVTLRPRRKERNVPVVVVPSPSDGGSSTGGLTSPQGPIVRGVTSPFSEGSSSSGGLVFMDNGSVKSPPSAVSSAGGIVFVDGDQVKHDVVSPPAQQQDPLPSIPVHDSMGSFGLGLSASAPEDFGSPGEVIPHHHSSDQAPPHPDSPESHHQHQHLSNHSQPSQPSYNHRRQSEPSMEEEYQAIMAQNRAAEAEARKSLSNFVNDTANDENSDSSNHAHEDHLHAFNNQAPELLPPSHQSHLAPSPLPSLGSSSFQPKAAAGRSGPELGIGADVAPRRDPQESTVVRGPGVDAETQTLVSLPPNAVVEFIVRDVMSASGHSSVQTSQVATPRNPPAARTGPGLPVTPVRTAWGPMTSTPVAASKIVGDAGTASRSPSHGQANGGLTPIRKDPDHQTETMATGHSPVFSGASIAPLNSSMGHPKPSDTIPLAPHSGPSNSSFAEEKENRSGGARRELFGASASAGTGRANVGREQLPKKAPVEEVLRRARAFMDRLSKERASGDKSAVRGVASDRLLSARASLSARLNHSGESERRLSGRFGTFGSGSSYRSGPSGEFRKAASWKEYVDEVGRGNTRILPPPVSSARLNV